jgi:nicotinamide mononucleotide (NMN) deamidase PncC
LGVSREDLAQFGAVRRQVAEGMALGALRVFDADVAIATTGIAGPGGGTPEKPVGTVWVAIGRNADSRSCGADTGPKEAGAGPKEAGAGPKEAGAAVEARLFRFEGSREENMASAVEAALGMVLERLA